MKTVKTASYNELYKKSVAIDSHKVIFMPIAKSASMSIKTPLIKMEHRYLTKDEVLRLDYKKVAVVRDTYERLVDCYLFFTNKVPKSKYTLNIEFNTFKEFIEKVYDTPDDVSNCHFRSQFNTLSHDGQFLPNVVIDIKYINNVTDHLPINSLKFYNNTYTDTNSYKSFYTEELLDLVNKRFKKDIEFFGFKF